MPLVKKETLKLASNDLRNDVLVYAISSSESDIRICQLINRVLGIDLTLAENLEIILKKDTQSFRRFIFESEEEIEKFILIVNRNGGNHLFSELKKIDFIFLVITDSPKEPIETGMQKLKTIPEISALYKVDQSGLKSFSRLSL